MNYNLTLTADQKERLLDALDVDHQHLHANMPPDESDREWRAAVEANEALQKMLAHAEVDPTGLPLRTYQFCALGGGFIVDVDGRTEAEARRVLTEKMKDQDADGDPLLVDDADIYARVWLTPELIESLVCEDSWEKD